MFLKLQSRTICWIGEMLGTLLVSQTVQYGAEPSMWKRTRANGKCRPSPWTRSAEKLQTWLHPTNMQQERQFHKSKSWRHLFLTVEPEGFFFWKRIFDLDVHLFFQPPILLQLLILPSVKIKVMLSLGTLWTHWRECTTVPFLNISTRWKKVVSLTFYSLLVTWCTNSLIFNNCTFRPHCIYVFYIYLRTNSDLCHLQHKLVGFYNRDEKCLLCGMDWVFK